ncbi:MAG: hypothetical protein B6U73_00100 [Desulfurococcales archaeon ex4484_204]|nr:MAG: hypothetical protein B6U73_00100 [Desulfurococcales archaeon ex4484_204]
MKFVVDAMLGDVARWLRILGYDTLYSKDFKDWEIERVARSEDRVIITRDVGLYRRARRKGLRAVLIEPGSIEDDLLTIALRTGIEIRFKPSRTRCPHCNTELVIIPKAEALSLVPSHIGTRYDTFWKCPKCGRVYWQGSHWRTINSIIDSVNRRLPSTY